MEQYRVIENKGSFLVGCIVDAFTAFYFDLRVETEYKNAVEILAKDTGGGAE